MQIRYASVATLSLLPLSVTCHAQSTATAHVVVVCSNPVSGKVALRWGHPTYAASDTEQYLSPPIVKVNCDGQPHPLAAVVINAPVSEFEIQTEGGIQTSYRVDVSIDHGSPNAASITLLNHGSPEVITRGAGFTLNRSAGPNKYGEQNFRLQIPNGRLPSIRLVATVTGPRTDTKFALRWGSPNYDKHKYLDLWKVSPGTSPTRNFPIRDPNSEFEIQTEGGTSTAYHLQGWLNFGSGESAMSNIDIVHQNQGVETSTGTSPGISFSPTHGNVYGEINVKVNIPDINPPPPPQNGGLSLLYNYGLVPASTGGSSSVPISFAGVFKQGSAQIVAGARLNFSSQPTSLTLNPGFEARTADNEPNLQPGSWTIKVGPYRNGQFTGEATTCDVVVTAGPGKVQSVIREPNNGINCPG